MEKLVKRSDSKCVDCVKKRAVTRDGLFCMACLQYRLDHDNPMPNFASGVKGRRLLDGRIDGGSAEMRDDGE